MDETWTRIAATDDVPDGESIPVEIMGFNLALYHVGGAFYCTDNVCTHAYALLSDGWLEDHLIECPLHNGQFDIRTGKGQGSPITKDLKTYPVRVSDGDVLVALA